MADQTWLVAVVVPITGPNPTRAWEDATGTLTTPGTLSMDDALFITGPLVAEPNDINNPDFDVDVRSHGRTLERAEED